MLDGRYRHRKGTEFGAIVTADDGNTSSGTAILGNAI
jgi:hypothetical protein